MTTIICSIKQLKKKARKVIFSDYRIILFATLFFTAVAVGLFLISDSLCELLCAGVSDDVRMMVYLTCDIGIFFICFPYALGYISLCGNIASGKSTELAALFGYYSDKKRLASAYEFLLLKIPSIFLRLIAPFIILKALFGYGAVYFENSFPDAFGVFSEHLPVIYFVFQLITVSAVFYMSGKLLLEIVAFCNGKRYVRRAGRLRSFTALRLSVFPLYIISVLTFGVLFLAYTVPFTVVLYSLFVSELEYDDTARDYTNISKKVYSTIETQEIN